jgi:molybdate transport system permease protein
MTDLPPRPAGRALPLQALLSSLLFAYLGFILAVFAANVIWLGRTDPSTGGSWLGGLLADEALAAEVWTSVKLSFVAALVTSVLGTIVAVPSGYALSRFRFPLARVLDTIVDLPIVVPPLIAGVALLLFFRQSWLGRLLDEHVLAVVYTRAGIVVAQFFVATAFSIRAVKAAFDMVNPRFEAVARSLGCTPWQAFVQVALPLARTGIVAGFVMTWARAMGEFGPIMMLAGATPGKTAVLPVTAFLAMSAGHVEASIAVVVLMVLLSAATLVVFKRLGGQGYVW